MENLRKDIQDKLKEGRSYRFMHDFELREQGEENEKMTVRGYATTFDQPYILYEYDAVDGYHVIIREQVDRNAFQECDMSEVIFQYNHAGHVFARLSNGTMRLSSDSHGLLTEADLGGTQIGRELYEEIKGGYTKKMSFGFTIEKEKVEKSEDKTNKTYEVLRTIEKVGKLYDVSAVSLPANDATEIYARNFSDGVIREIEEELRERDRREKQKKKLRILSEVF